MWHSGSQSKLESKDFFAHFKLPELPRNDWSGSDTVLCNNILIRRQTGPQKKFERAVPRRFIDSYVFIFTGIKVVIFLKMTIYNAGVVLYKRFADAHSIQSQLLPILTAE